MGLRQSKIVLCAANNAKIDVQGVADAKVSALSPNGECYETSTKIYVVHNVNEVYLSLDVLIGLRIVNEFFPTAGAGNQHGAQASAWDQTGTVTEQLPHASFIVKVDGSGRISQRTRQHLCLFVLHDSSATQHAGRSGSSIASRQNRRAPHHASQGHAPHSPHSPRIHDEEAGSRTPATQGRECASQPPEDPGLLHNFGDRGFYYRNDVCDNDNRDVDELFGHSQDVGDQDFGDQDFGDRDFGDRDLDD